MATVAERVARRSREPAEEWCLLAEIPQVDQLGLFLGDEGGLHVCVRVADLRQARFDRIDFELTTHG